MQKQQTERSETIEVNDIPDIVVALGSIPAHHEGAFVSVTHAFESVV